MGDYQMRFNDREQEFIKLHKEEYKKFSAKFRVKEKKDLSEKEKIQEEFSEMAERKDIFYKFRFVIENTEDKGLRNLCNFFRTYYQKNGRFTEKQMEYLEKNYHHMINKYYAAYQDLLNHHEPLVYDLLPNNIPHTHISLLKLKRQPKPKIQYHYQHVADPKNPGKTIRKRIKLSEQPQYKLKKPGSPSWIIENSVNPASL